MAGIEVQPTLTYRAEAFKSGEKFLFTLLNIESLPDKDCLGSESDAYFRIKVPGNSTRKFQEREKKNSFVFNGGVGTEIELVCMDWHPEGHDDDLVTGTIELTDAILDGEEQTVVLQLEDDSSSSEDEAIEGEEENYDVSSQLRRRGGRKKGTGQRRRRRARPNRTRNKGRLRHVDTGRGFRRVPKGPIQTGEAGNNIQRAWEANRDALVRGTENNIGSRANTTCWQGRGHRNLRLDLQSRDDNETRFAFQENNGVEGQAHLVESSIPETVGDRLKASALWGAMKMSLRTGTLWEVRGD